MLTVTYSVLDAETSDYVRQPSIEVEAAQPQDAARWVRETFGPNVNVLAVRDDEIGSIEFNL